MKNIFITIVMLVALIGCSGLAPVPAPTPVTQDCLGDFDRDGVVSVPEMRRVVLVKMEGEIDPEVIIEVDQNGNGAVDDVELYKVVANSNYCQYLKGE